MAKVGEDTGISMEDHETLLMKEHLYMVIFYEV